MNKIMGVFTAVSLLSGSVAMAEDKQEVTKTHETDGKKTTRSKKVKQTTDGAGNTEVKTETVKKTELSTPTGNGGEKRETVRTHETDGKKTTSSKKVTHKADSDGNEVKTETVNKTKIK